MFATLRKQASMCTHERCPIFEISECIFIICCVLVGTVCSRGGEFKKLEIQSHFAPGYSCTNSLSHYLNIRMKTSVVLEELSAHLLVCICICEVCNHGCVSVIVSVCVCVCVCVSPTGLLIYSNILSSYGYSVPTFPRLADR